MTASTDTLLLDDRQRAMLREMGVQVWQPRAALPTPASASPAEPTAALAPPVRQEPTNVAAASAPSATSAATPGKVAAGSPSATPAPVNARSAPSAAVAPHEPAAAAPQPVLLGDWQALFPAAGDDPQAPVWLVLADSAGPDPREGDAGRLLLAMLKAAGLDQNARVWAASVGRPDAAGLPLAEALSQAVAAHRPAMVLALGRLSAQAASGRNEPLGKLRGSVLQTGAVPLVASYEPAYLLRAQDDKARAWEDLCRALAAVP